MNWEYLQLFKSQVDHTTDRLANCIADPTRIDEMIRIYNNLCSISNGMHYEISKLMENSLKPEPVQPAQWDKEPVPTTPPEEEPERFDVF